MQAVFVVTKKSVSIIYQRRVRRPNVKMLSTPLANGTPNGSCLGLILCNMFNNYTLEKVEVKVQVC